MRRGALSSFLVTAIATATVGCGTAHYMLPGRPLEKKEWQLSVTWHYDFNHLTPSRFAFFPDLNAYVGAGRDCNLGFGAHTFGFPSHLSFAKYWPKDNGRCWASYGHLALGLGNNPPLEVGGLYSKDNGDLRHTFSLGLGIGQFSSRMISAAGLRGKLAATPNPVFKYRMEGKDFTFSYTHILRQSWTAMHPLLEAAQTANDTVLSYGKGELKAINSVGSLEGFPPSSGWAFVSATGDTTILARHWPCPDCFFDRQVELERFLGNGLEVFHLYSDSTVVIANLDELRKMWRRKGQLTVPRYSPAVVERILRTRNILTDASIGVAVNAHPKRRE